MIENLANEAAIRGKLNEIIDWINKQECDHEWTYLDQSAIYICPKCSRFRFKPL